MNHLKKLSCPIVVIIQMSLRKKGILSPLLNGSKYFLFHAFSCDLYDECILNI